MRFFKKLIVVLVILILIFLAGVTTKTSPRETFTPAKSVASIGDSITQAANACTPYEECPEVSWSSGMKTPTNTTGILFSNETPNGVESVATKISQLPGGSGKKLTSFNNARSYTKSSDLSNQANITVSQNPEFVTIMSGANDLCTVTEQEMTSPAEYRANVRESLKILNKGLPKSKILIASIPNIYNLWKVGHNIDSALGKWDSADLCQSMLENPTSLQKADQERRLRVLAANIEFNTILAEECDKATNCLFDGNKVFNAVFTPKDLSPVDFFHPSISGQQKIADSIWTPAVALHSRVSRGVVKRSSSDAPLIDIVSPTGNEIVSGTAYKAIVKVSSTNPLETVYADTQIGGVDLIYSEKNDYWFLTIDTTLAPDGLTTFFSVIAVDIKGEMTVTEKVEVTVNNEPVQPDRLPLPMVTPTSTPSPTPTEE